MSILDKRSEIIFCYDIKDANPNGDPLDSNKPRIDEETGENLVTDVRLKRTVRDYFFDFKDHNGQGDKDIFVREIVYDDKNGFINDGKRRSKDFEEDKENILNTCIDIRLFGGVLPLNKDSITFTGPVQFQMGRSMHKVNQQYIKGTGAFASGDKKKQATFREEHMLSYSFINFYGIINENAAKHTKLTEEDITLLMEGIWEGTKNLISRSKFGQMPRLLVKVNYGTKGFYIGDLNKSLKLISDKQDEEIRGIDDFQLDITEFKRLMDKYQNKIESIEYKFDDRINFILNGETVNFEEVLGDKKKEIQY
jgi:CRISPR-associated protein Csh2